jgi:hypothetical protein
MPAKCAPYSDATRGRIDAVQIGAVAIGSDGRRTLCCCRAGESLRHYVRLLLPAWRKLWPTYASLDQGQRLKVSTVMVTSAMGRTKAANGTDCCCRIRHDTSEAAAATTAHATAKLSFVP